jgi:hypothetical protein
MKSVHSLAWMSFVTAFALATAWVDSYGRDPLGEALAVAVFCLLGINITSRLSRSEREWLIGAFTVAFGLRVVTAIAIFAWTSGSYPHAPLYDARVAVRGVPDVGAFGVVTGDGAYFFSAAMIGALSNRPLFGIHTSAVIPEGYATLLQALLQTFGLTQMIGAYFSAFVTSLGVVAIYKLALLTTGDLSVAKWACKLSIGFPPFVFFGSIIGLDGLTIVLTPVLIYWCLRFVNACRFRDLMAVAAVVAVVLAIRLTRGIQFACIAAGTILPNLVALPHSVVPQRVARIGSARRGLAILGVLLGVVLIGWVAVEQTRVPGLSTLKIAAVRGARAALISERGGITMYRDLAGSTPQAFSVDSVLLLPVLVGVEMYLPIVSQVAMDDLVLPRKVSLLAEAGLWPFWLLPLAGVGLIAAGKLHGRLYMSLLLPAAIFLVILVTYGGSDTGTVRWRASVLPILLIWSAVGNKAVALYPRSRGFLMIRLSLLAGALLTNFLYLAHKL